MHLFSNAQNTVLNNARIVDQSVTTNNGPNGIQALLGSSIPDAAYDSSARDPPPQCFPGTREQYIEEITQWALDRIDHNGTPMFWMKGPAGVGKSAIAQTCSEKIGGRLGASFFFARNVRDNPKQFFTTIAYQLSTKSQAYSEILDSKIRRDVTLVTKSMSRQFQELIAQPLQELEKQGRGMSEMAIFIDGLDECNGEAAQCDIIEIIATSVREQTTRFRWAFFSRAEPHIEATFSEDNIAVLCRQTILPISREVDGEIELYLREGFKTILRRRIRRVMAFPWPSENDMDTLVNASAGLFIYAATVLRFVGQLNSLGPEDQLQAVLAAISDFRDHSPGTTASPFAELDAFYMLIMKRIPSAILPFIQRILFATTIVRGSSSGWCAQVLSNVLGFSEANFRIACDTLHAVLRVQDRQTKPIIDPAIDPAQPFDPTADGDKHYIKIKHAFTGLEGYISFYHKSFLDFLIDSTRSNAFCIKSPTFANVLFQQCLELHDNVIGSYDFNTEPLALAPGVTNSASSLTWPHNTEYINSFLKARVHGTTIRVMFKLYRSFPLDHKLLEKLVNLDYAKMLRLDLNSGKCRFARHVDHAIFYHPPKSLVQQIHEMLPKHLRNRILRPYGSNIGFNSPYIPRKLSKKRFAEYVIGNGTKKVFIYRGTSERLIFATSAEMKG